MMDINEEALRMFRKAKRRLRDRECYAKRNKDRGEPYTDHGSLSMNKKIGEIKQD